MLYGAIAGGQPLTAAVLKQPVEPTASRLAAITGRLSLIKRTLEHMFNSCTMLTHSCQSW